MSVVISVRSSADALAAMEARFAALHDAGLWPTRRNSILANLGPHPGAHMENSA